MNVIGKAEAILSLLPDSQVSVDINDNVTWIVPSTSSLTDEQISTEQTRLEVLWQSSQEQSIINKQSAINKLTALGLTADEIKSLLGTT